MVTLQFDEEGSDRNLLGTLVIRLTSFGQCFDGMTGEGRSCTLVCGRRSGREGLSRSSDKRTKDESKWVTPRGDPFNFPPSYFLLPLTINLWSTN